MALQVILNGTDVTDAVIRDSLSVKFNTADFSLKDGADYRGRWGDPGIAVSITDAAHGIAWSGLIREQSFAPVAARPTGHHITRYMARNDLEVPAPNTSPFDLSDTPGDAYDDILSEAGDNIQTEDGANTLQTEGARTVAYQDLSLRWTRNLDNSEQVSGRATIWQGGLEPGQTVAVTCGDLPFGWSGGSWTVQSVEVRWPFNDPEIYLEFGDTVVTMHDLITP